MRRHTERKKGMPFIGKEVPERTQRIVFDGRIICLIVFENNSTIVNILKGFIAA